jgi:hypothetical protein
MRGVIGPSNEMKLELHPSFIPSFIYHSASCTNTTTPHEIIEILSPNKTQELHTKSRGSSHR